MSFGRLLGYAIHALPAPNFLECLDSYWLWRATSRCQAFSVIYALLRKVRQVCVVNKGSMALKSQESAESKALEWRHKEKCAVAVTGGIDLTFYVWIIWRTAHRWSQQISVKRIRNRSPVPKDCCADAGESNSRAPAVKPVRHDNQFTSANTFSHSTICRPLLSFRNSSALFRFPQALSSISGHSMFSELPMTVGPYIIVLYPSYQIWGLSSCGNRTVGLGGPS